MLLVACLFQPAGHAQIFFNNGAQVTVKEDAQVGILGGLLNNSGDFDNGGYVLIVGDTENNDTMSGNDGFTAIPSSTYVLKGDWINNSAFNAEQGRVEFDTAMEQLITGSSPTVFHDLVLLGGVLHNVKRQTIDAFIDQTGSLQVNDAELATDNANMMVRNRSANAVTHDLGFVSSLGDAYLGWDMNTSVIYEYPVGSSLGTLRKRVVHLTPASSADNSMGVRFANLDASAEGFDRDMREQDICEIIRIYYHRIYRLSGADDMDVDIQYVAAEDGSWDFMVNWENNPAREWSITDGSAAGANFISAPSWPAFQDSSFAFGRGLKGYIAIDPPSICAGETATVTVSGPGSQADITWISPVDPSLPAGTQDLPLTFQVSPSQTTEYIVEISRDSCSVLDTALLVVEPFTQLSITISDPPVDCSGGPVTFTATTSGGGPSDVITWYVNGVLQPGQNSNTFLLQNPLEGMVVRADYTTLAGCSGSASSNPVMISTGSTVALDLTPDALICAPEGETVPLYAAIFSQAGSDITLSWTSDAGLSCELDCSANFVTPIPGDTTWVYATVEDRSNGCKAVDSVQVCAIDEASLTLPTAFTPDGDDDNDELFILGELEEFELNLFRVWNRWGELVFETDRFDIGWDGVFRGEEQEMDVYVYYVDATFVETGERHQLKGAVALLR